MDVRCPQCGAIVDPKAMFCEYCGYKLAHEERDYDSEVQYENFYNSCLALNLDNPQNIRTYWWAIAVIYNIMDLMLLFMFGYKEPLKGFVFIGAVSLAIAYFAYDRITNFYVGQIVFPKAPDAIYNTLTFIEKQLEKNAKKKTWRWRNSLRQDAWLRCLTSIQQRPAIPEEANRRIDGLRRMYPSKRFVSCLLCLGWNFAAMGAVFLITAIYNGFV